MSNGNNPAAGAGANVPATALSSWWTQNQNVPSALVIGSQSYNPPNWQTSSIWLVVVDLTTLDVVAADISDGNIVPGDISPYAGNPRYFLYAISNLAWATVMPQGPLWNLLVAAGSGPKLNRLAQIYATLSTGYLGTFSNILAASMAEDDLPGFETLSMNHLTILTMAFMPVTVNGQTIYAPVNQG
jgi:hypothetical protein